MCKAALSATCCRSAYNHSRQVTAIAINAKSDTVVSGTEDGSIKLWKQKYSVNNPKLEPEDIRLSSNKNKIVNVIAIDSNGKWVAAADAALPPPSCKSCWYLIEEAVAEAKAYILTSCTLFKNT
ncbi:MAG: hypothetical protein F6K31_34610 [Symploca sp. SIO2G7]|nr:hypothetical protein [Symploca sp. SIO2G7]